MNRLISLLLCLFLLLACAPTLSACSNNDPPSNSTQAEQNTQPHEDRYYILNTSTKKYHRTSCSYLPSAKNSKKVLKNSDELQNASPCDHCKPQFS